MPAIDVRVFKLGNQLAAFMAKSTLQRNEGLNEFPS